MKKIKIPLHKVLIQLPIIIGILFLVGVIALKAGGAFKEGETTIITTSTLTDAIDIAELSTGEFTYNGIAEYKKENSDKVACRIRYKAKVKASVNMEEIDFVIDEENKTITPVLPEITLEPILDEQNGFSFMPDNYNGLNIGEVREVCEKDVMEEASQTSELRNTAEENLKDTIQALTYPIINSKGYTLVWE